MNQRQKAILIRSIIIKLNEHLKAENDTLCKRNLFSQQKPLHGGNMFFRLATLDDKSLKDIASKCGL